MTLAEVARGFVVGGVLYYLLWWWWPEYGRLFGRGGLWRSAPGWLKPMAQRRGQEVYLLTVLSESWAAVLILTGIGLATGAVAPPRWVVEAEFGFILAPFVVAGAVAAWRKLRSKPGSDQHSRI